MESPTGRDVFCKRREKRFRKTIEDDVPLGKALHPTCLRGNVPNPNPNVRNMFRKTGTHTHTDLSAQIGEETPAV